MRPRTFLTILAVAALGLIGTYIVPQTTINGGRTALGVIDNSGATHTLPMGAGTSVPGTCTVGELFFKTNATAGQNIYQCAATNVFTQQLNSGTATGGGITMYSATGLTVTANTYYLPIGGGGGASTTETNVDIDAPAAATITNMYVQLSVALGMGNSGVFTFRKNASSQSITCTISGASATACNDTTHSFAVSQGDLLTIQLVTTGTIVVTPNILIAAQFGNITATGTVNTGTINQIAYYAAGGTAVSGETLIGNGNYYGVLGKFQQAAAQTGITNTSYVDLATPESVTFTCAAACNVDAAYQDNCLISGGNDNIYTIVNVDGSNVTATGNSITLLSGSTASGTCQTSYSGSLTAASHTIKIQHHVDNSHTATISVANLSVTQTP